MKSDIVLNSPTRAAVTQSGEFLLKTFHEEYAKDSASLETEYWRGRLTEWRHTLNLILGEDDATEIVEQVSDRLKLSIPHGGMLSDDRTGYLGFDSGSHMFIGKLE